MKISDDGYAMILLCTDLALTTNEKPFTVVQWNDLATKLILSNLTPKDLFNINDTIVQSQLNLSKNEINRIDLLLSRAGQVGVEIASLNEKGIYIVTRADKEYPQKFKSKLKKYAPPVLFYAGNLDLLHTQSVAIVGSRDIEEEDELFTINLSKKISSEGLTVVSGGAKGVDSFAEKANIEVDGNFIVVVSGGLITKIRTKSVRERIIQNKMLVLSAIIPSKPFKVYYAMERNKYIYSLADYSVVIRSAYNTGGTWNGAIENLKKDYSVLFVKDNKFCKGNIELLKSYSAVPITEEQLNEKVILRDWFLYNKPKEKVSPIQQRLKL